MQNTVPTTHRDDDLIRVSFGTYLALLELRATVRAELDPSTQWRSDAEQLAYLRKRLADIDGADTLAEFDRNRASR